MEETKHIGFRLHEMNHTLRSAINRGIISRGIDPMTTANSWIIGYINHSMEVGNPVYQKELETRFKIPKSTLADMLQHFEKKGMIKRVASQKDGRVKEILLTDEGISLSNHIRESIDAVENMMRENISEEDMETFIRVLDEMQRRAKEYKQEAGNKEEEIC